MRKLHTVIAAAIAVTLAAAAPADARNTDVWVRNTTSLQFEQVYRTQTNGHWVDQAFSAKTVRAYVPEYPDSQHMVGAMTNDGPFGDITGSAMYRAGLPGGRDIAVVMRLGNPFAGANWATCEVRAGSDVGPIVDDASCTVDGDISGTDNRVTYRISSDRY